MKKLLLGLGAVSIAALPVLAVVSCSNATTPTVSKDLAITTPVTAVSQEMISAAAVVINATPAVEATRITALKTVFAGITEANYKNFKATATATAGTEVITLTANDGYAFGKTAKTLVSKVVVPTATPTIATESAKLVTKAALVVTETAAVVAPKITSDATLETYYAKVALATGFSYTFKSATANVNNVDVIVTVSGPEGTTPAEVTIVLTGFATTA